MRLEFPVDFAGVIESDIATPESVSYYGASIAFSGQRTETKDDDVFLEERHAVQDFTYGDSYLADWVLGEAGGAGLEWHTFHHLDMPISQQSGYYVLAKF